MIKGIFLNKPLLRVLMWVVNNKKILIMTDNVKLGKIILGTKPSIINTFN